MVQALEFAGRNGLPGGHHFYITFRTDHPATVIPARLRAQYPAEMTIVLQHQFRDLVVDEAAGMLSVGLSFNGIASTLRIPLGAIVAFADPFVRQGMAFRAETPVVVEAAPVALPVPAEAPAVSQGPQVVSLDAFRRRPTALHPAAQAPQAPPDESPEKS